VGDFVEPELQDGAGLWNADGMPDRLHPLLLSWRGQGMSREERTSS
jgi:hypothetical protein